MKIFNTGRFSKSRLEAFSDGVFAIIVTLLVLELKVPEIEDKELAQVLRENFPKFLSWVISFLIISIFWVNHHRFFDTIRHTDNGLLWLNILFLMFISFIPFPTALLGTYYPNLLAIVIFGSIMFFASLVFAGMHLYTKRHPYLLEENYGIKQKHFFHWLGPVAFGVAILSAFIHVFIAIILYALIPLIFIVPPYSKEEDSPQGNILW